ncbi:MAG: hypothetical protein U0525_04270 [Patescibacteria group bacterium]
MILVDIGSMTVKTYKFNNIRLTHVSNKTLDLKTGFDEITGIQEQKISDLIKHLSSIRQKFPDESIRLYATAVFRKLNKIQKTQLIDRMFLETGLFLNIIDHDLENNYLEKALLSKCKKTHKVLLINIGGGSTELVFVKNGKPTRKLNINVGAAIVNEQFPDLNDTYVETPLNEIIEFISSHLPKLHKSFDYAFYNGQEITYMKLASYKLIRNTFMSDDEHRYMINFQDFKNRNTEVCCETKITELEKLMPENPKWMRGARACSLIAQAIASHFKIKYIVPSDTDLIHGVVVKEFRSVTISGSFRKHLDYISSIKSKLERIGVVVRSPRFTVPKNPGSEFVTFEGEDHLKPLELERYHLDSIDKSDALIVCNKDGYVGASSMIEIGYAHRQNKRIIFTENPKEFMLQTLPHEVLEMNQK